LSYNTGIKNISTTANLLGFGQLTQIDLPYETDGLIPTDDWREERGAWYAGETLLVGIGQGPLTVTPLQMASFYQTIAAEGKRYKPRVVKEINGRNLSVSLEPELLGENLISKSTIDIIKEGMKAVTSRGGTAYSAFRSLARPEVLGKTGTAEVFYGSGSNRRVVKHTWFAAIAPATDPKIVVIILVENGFSGEKTSAPYAKQIIDAYFNRLKLD
jgi:penicillin-binding protein 2